MGREVGEVDLVWRNHARPTLASPRYMPLRLQWDSRVNCRDFAAAGAAASRPLTAQQKHTDPESGQQTPGQRSLPLCGHAFDRTLQGSSQNKALVSCPGHVSSACWKEEECRCCTHFLRHKGQWSSFKSKGSTRRCRCMHVCTHAE